MGENCTRLDRFMRGQREREGGRLVGWPFSLHKERIQSASERCQGGDGALWCNVMIPKNFTGQSSFESRINISGRHRHRKIRLLPTLEAPF